jgi:hypothetical protein
VLKFGTSQSRPTIRKRLSTNLVVCRIAMPHSLFIVRQVRMAFGGKTIRKWFDPPDQIPFAQTQTIF